MWAQSERVLRDATSRIVDGVAAFIPGLLALLALFALSVLVASLTRIIVSRALGALDFDRRAPFLGLGMLAEWSVNGSATWLVARGAQWLILVCGLLVALTALDAAIPSHFAMSVFAYVPGVLAAFIIMAVGTAVAQFLARGVLIGAVNMQMQSARLLSLTVKWLVLVVSAAMALEQLRVGRQILMLAFGILFGGVVLAAALAVGLGARDAVGRVIARELERQRGHATVERVDHV
jgi:hypothetical protein